MKKNTAPLAEPAAMRTAGSVMETSAAAQATPHYVLRLYVTGATTRSARAISNIRKICEEHLEGHYDLEVVDISQHPMLAEGEQIIAAPTLIKKLPLPLRRFIGDMSHTERILVGLDLRDTAAKPSFNGAG
jgi:circadian clock protein KaiB